MAIPLREPFFLRGRKSVKLRAIRMSLALSVLAGGAGVVAGTLYVVLVRMLHLAAQSSDVSRIAMSGSTAAMALAVLVGIPCFWWLGHSTRGIVRRATCIVVVAAGPLLLCGSPIRGLIRPASSPPGGLPSDMLAFGGLLLWAPVKEILPLSLLWPAWTAACFRTSREWMLMAGLSGLSLPLWILSYNFATHSMGTIHGWLPAGDVSLFVLGIAFQSTTTAQFFALLVVPWGIPFWCPPKAEMPPVEAT